MQETIIALAGLVVGALMVAAAMAAGYWAGRNSIEMPFRSATVTKPKLLEPLKTATGEPDGGDFYQDAAFGDDRRPVSTIKPEV